MYALSNRQNKELRTRGTEIRVAIPCPVLDPEITTDEKLIRYVRSCLLNLDDITVTAEIAEMSIQLPAFKGAGGLTEIFGALNPKPAANKPEQLRVMVIIATLRPADCKHVSQLVQWPGSYKSLDGTEYP